MHSITELNSFFPNIVEMSILELEPETFILYNYEVSFHYNGRKVYFDTQCEHRHITVHRNILCDS